ncbi:hypothetical protein [Palleronia sp.]|uniref:hypothetical protein n=1 Tax=Palleronia sp. TaxID=1940284 RepID=UPI0035C85674
MDWTAQVDDYCERLGPGLMAEPANALTNLAFIAVALWLWPKSGGVERLLCLLLLAIGIGSGLFHTYAASWAGLADTVPILLYILVYIYAANLRIVGLPVWGALAGVAVALPVMILGGRVFAMIPGFEASAFYWPVPVLIAGYALWARKRAPLVARGWAIGAGVLVLSLVARSVDDALCPVWPVGTHFAWHLLNAAMLGWMITVLRRHRLEPDGVGR